MDQKILETKKVEDSSSTMMEIDVRFSKLFNNKDLIMFGDEFLSPLLIKAKVSECRLNVDDMAKRLSNIVANVVNNNNCICFKNDIALEKNAYIYFGNMHIGDLATDKVYKNQQSADYVISHASEILKNLTTKESLYISEECYTKGILLGLVIYRIRHFV